MLPFKLRDAIAAPVVHKAHTSDFWFCFAGLFVCLLNDSDIFVQALAYSLTHCLQRQMPYPFLKRLM